MAKMKTETAIQHRKAAALADLDRDLTPDEREFVLDHWMEEGTARLDGAFFTPGGLATDLILEAFGAGRIIDLCAGIGRLAWTAHQYLSAHGAAREIVCVEKNPEYVRIGRKILPEARWICGDVFDVPTMDLGGRFDVAVANPPFGRVSREGRTAPATAALSSSTTSSTSPPRWPAEGCSSSPRSRPPSATADACAAPRSRPPSTSGSSGRRA